MIRLFATTALLLAVCQTFAAAQPVTSLEDITFWVGEGANSAAIAIDWDGQSSNDEAYVWGYRWNNSSTADDALRDVLSADTRLYAKLATVPGLGTAVIGLGYDDNDDQQFALTDGTVFDGNGINQSNLNDGETSVDAADRYAEGWFLGYWHLGFADENPFASGSWTSTPTGVEGLQLTDQSWLSFAYTTDTFSTSEFAENLFAAETTLTADFDTDGDTDGADFLTWQRGFDSTFDSADLQTWLALYGNANASIGVVSVPEPTSLLVSVWGVFLFFGAGLRERRRTTRRSI